MDTNAVMLHTITSVDVNVFDAAVAIGMQGERAMRLLRRNADSAQALHFFTTDDITSMPCVYHFSYQNRERIRRRELSVVGNQRGLVA